MKRFNKLDTDLYKQEKAVFVCAAITKNEIDGSECALSFALTNKREGHRDVANWGWLNSKRLRC